MNQNELVTATMKMEGERFKLFKRIDNCKSLYEYPHLQKELHQLNIKIETYQQVVKDMASLKRRMNR